MATKTKSAGEKAAETKAAKKLAGSAVVSKAVAAAASAAAVKAKVTAIKTVAKAKEEVQVVEQESDLSVAGAKELAACLRSNLQDAGFGVSPALALASVKAFEASVTEFISKGTDITLPGFGKFKVNLRAGGERRNPSTGGTVTVPASYVPVFKVGKALKEAAKTRAVEA